MLKSWTTCYVQWCCFDVCCLLIVVFFNCFHLFFSFSFSLTLSSFTYFRFCTCFRLLFFVIILSLSLYVFVVCCLFQFLILICRFANKIQTKQNMLFLLCCHGKTKVKQKITNFKKGRRLGGGEPLPNNLQRNIVKTQDSSSKILICCFCFHPSQKSFIVCFLFLFILVRHFSLLFVWW